MEYAKGERINVIDDEGQPLVTGTIIRTGTRHVAVVTDDGETYDVPHAMVRSVLVRQGNKEVLKEQEIDGRRFTLVKEEQNKDGVLSVVFKVFLNDTPISESEELVTNVYDQEHGWSAPDDFDDNKMDLIKNTYESGFDLIVDSYDNIEQAIANNATPETTAPEKPEEPQGVPAFAPGAKPGSPADESPADAEAPESDAEAPVAGGEPHASPAGESAAPAESDEPAAEAVGASLEHRSFRRSIMSGSKKLATELLRNPQHRINPVLRAEMTRRNIDSGATDDLELAEDLKDFDYGTPAPKTGKPY